MERVWYCFWDYDDASGRDLDISGEALETLIDTCFRYADTFAVTYSFRGYHAAHGMEGSIFQYCVAEKAVSSGRVRCSFKCCEETRRFLSDSYACLFGWYWNETDRGSLPEDLAFYRSDGSCFFASETHEGHCYLYPRGEEDVSSVLRSEGWDPVPAGTVPLDARADAIREPSLVTF